MIAKVGESFAILSVGMMSPEGGANVLQEYLERKPASAGITGTNSTGSASSDGTTNDQNPANQQPVTPEISTTPPKRSPKGGTVIEEIIGYKDYVAGKIALTNLTGVKFDIAGELKNSPNFTLKKDNTPQVLIMHTHTTESYMSYYAGYYNDSDAERTLDERKNVVAVGERIAAQLENAGIGVLHDKTVHDNPEYTGAYTRSLKTVQAIMKKNPSIKVVLDVHRDSINRTDTTRVKPTVMVNGKKAAQVMLVSCVSDSKTTPHPNWKQNFRTALQVQNQIASDYEGLARPLRLVGLRYNQHVAPGSFLIEMGSDANTLEEALYSGELVGKSLAKVLNTLK